MSKPTVILTDNVSPLAADILKSVAEVRVEPTCDGDDLKALLKQADAIIVRSATRIGAEALEGGDRLKIIGRAGVGVDNIDLAEATKNGVVVVNSPEGNTVAASEHTVAMMMALLRNVAQGHAGMVQGHWNRKALTGVEMFGKILGIVGFGKIGSRVARVAQALGAHILAYDPFLPPERAKQLDVKSVSLDELLAQSDIISLHAPKTRETHHLINEKTLSQCKKGVRIVNCARGALINDEDLVIALKSGHVEAVALDVFNEEPLPKSHPFVQLAQQPEFEKRLVLTPHLGASTEEAQVQVAVDVAQQIRTYFEEGVAQSAVNIPALRHEIMAPVKQYLPMAETLGRCLGQWISEPVTALEVVAGGAMSEHNTSPITLAVLKGLLSAHHEGINYVNAQLAAEQQGIHVKESHVAKLPHFQNKLTLLATTAKGQQYTLAGSVYHDNQFHLVQVNEFPLSLEPTSHVLLVPHENKPGMVGIVASVLGQEQINISGLDVAKSAGDDRSKPSVMVFNLDTPVPESCLNTLRQQSGILSVEHWLLG